MKSEINLSKLGQLKGQAIILFIIMGTIAYFSVRLQKTQTVDEGNQPNKPFSHPYMQTWEVMLGQLLCLPVYLYQKRKSNKQLQTQNLLEETTIQFKKQHKARIFWIPSFLDSVGTIIQLVSLNFLPITSYLLVKGASLITTLFFQKLLMRQKIYKRHLIGCFCSLLGVVVIGLSAFVEDKSTNSFDLSQQMVGYTLLILSLILNGLQFAYEEYLFKNYRIEPLEMNGYEGLFGLIILTVVSTIMNFIPCNFPGKICVITDTNESIMEAPIIFFREVFRSWILVLLNILLIFSISSFHLNSLKITMLFDAMTRALMVMLKTLISWLIGLSVTYFINDQKYQLQSLNSKVIFIKIVGFLFVLFGFLIYTRVIFKQKMINQKETITEVEDSLTRNELVTQESSKDSKK